MSETEDYDKSATPTAHASTHEDGGSDEIDVEGLSGQLADEQPSSWDQVSGKPSTFTPAAHKTSHQDAGADEISVQGLSGELADPQTPKAHKTSHQDAGADEISVQGLSGELADPQTPKAHKTSHQDAGADEISVQGLSGLLTDDQHVLDSEVDLRLPTTENVVGGARALNTVYQNTSGKVMFANVSVYNIQTGTAIAYCDSENPPTNVVGYVSNTAAYLSFFHFIVLPGYYYKVAHDVEGSVGAWIEWT